ncbi:MAG: hypothetical protein LBU61_06100 [Coriobacteriales bacterium]|jgi:hypothetical protein|nr:hypothetical protein [Coriobacteriales bacterium]
MSKSQKHFIRVTIISLLFFTMVVAAACKAPISSSGETEVDGIQSADTNPNGVISTNDIEDADAITEAIFEDSILRHSGVAGSIKYVQVTLASDGTDTWAIAFPITEGVEGHSLFYVYAVDDSVEQLGVRRVFGAYPPVSSGLSIDIYEYDGKYLVCGGVANYYITANNENQRDLSGRTHIDISSLTSTIRISVESTEWVCGYICILDSEPVEAIIYDSETVLYKLSDHANDVLVTRH